MSDAEQHIDTITERGTASLDEDKRTAARRLFEQTMAKFKDTYSLLRGEENKLTPKQIQALFTARDADEAYAVIDDYDPELSHRTWDASDAEVSALLDEEEYELLDEADLLEDIRSEIIERDEATVLTLLRNSDEALFRYYLDVELPSGIAFETGQERQEVLDEIADAAGLNRNDPVTTTRLTELVNHSNDGGRLYVVWTDNPEDAFALSQPPAEQDGVPVEPPSTVTFTDTHLMVLSGFWGSGFVVPLPGITATWAPQRVTIDAPKVGPGHSWHDVRSAGTIDYGGAYTLNR
jgi:hypothetical protein